MNTVYDFNATTSNGDIKLLADYKGKPLLIVNTASKCGYTPQFKGLQELYEKYQEQGFTVLGFPSGQFNDQEFDDIQKTTEFCQVNYGVTFPLFAKVDVNGDHANSLFTFLKKQEDHVLSQDINWNFTKFLIDREGNVVQRYEPAIEPSSMEEDILKVL